MTGRLQSLPKVFARVASETALQRQQRRLDGHDRGFEFGYDIGKMHDADEACSTARSAGGVGACVDDWREGKGDAGGDLGSEGAAAPDHSSDLCLAVCRLADATRTCMSTRDDLCAMASKMCVESGVLSCVRWSGDSFLVLGKFILHLVWALTLMSWFVHRRLRRPVR